MFQNLGKYLCWYQIWSLLFLSSSIGRGNCPRKCDHCEEDTKGNLIKATCKDVQIPSLPDTLTELRVSDASKMTSYASYQFSMFMLADKVNLTILKVQRYEIAVLRDECFRGSPNLLVLDLSKNSISQISENNFNGLHKVLFLSLTMNKLTNISNFDFRQLSALEELDIAQNSVNSISENAFKGLMNLKRIDLQSNNISSMNKAVFQGLQTLEDINLQNNQLTQIESGLFGNLPNLRRLNLKMNNIQFIHPESMTNTWLTYLDLSQNEITQIPTEFLQRVSNKSLEVNAARNHISKINDGGLQSVTLETLYLVSNSLSLIHKDALRSSFIKKLDFQQNCLRHLPEGLKKYLNQSNTVLLANNPWSCDCSIHWVKSLLKKDILEPVCAEPLSYHGQTLSQVLDDLEISCGNSEPLPVPKKHILVPPRLKPAIPHLLEKTSTYLTTTTTTKYTTSQTDKEKGGNSNIAIIAGMVSGVIVLVVLIGIVIIMNIAKVKVAPELKLNCTIQKMNFKPQLKYMPQSKEYLA